MARIARKAASARVNVQVPTSSAPQASSAHTSGRVSYGGREHQLQEIVGQCNKHNGDDFESYRVTTDGSHRLETHDPYDYVYHNLPNKHHVLKTVKDCIHCGAMRFQYEGPDFCCRKGKLKVFIPEVPQDLQ
ncbi:uncharacterized protein LOC119328342 isoform X2 [Triticum dicoccoides]|uniref:uncharacterized protein LOC119328342 isoform X2 n=1 Tax=Triticum dicoccoides TaxID=85692 RepID=UPI0018914455|nr:uncharacterized protein LOC119328342 isoform X2 [Triticum dicoccoides]